MDKKRKLRVTFDEAINQTLAIVNNIDAKKIYNEAYGTMAVNCEMAGSAPYMIVVDGKSYAEATSFTQKAEAVTEARKLTNGGKQQVYVVDGSGQAVWGVDCDGTK